MPVAYRSAASDTELTGSDPDPVVTKPAGVVDGDLLIAFHGTDSSGTLGAMSVTGGWTEIGSQSLASCGAVKVYRRIASSEPASYTFSNSVGSDSVAGILAFQAGTFDPTTPLAAGPTFTTNASTSTSHVAPSVTGVVDGDLVCAFFGGHNTNTTRSYGAASGMTERFDASPVGWVVMAADTLDLASAGATGTKTATCSASIRAITVSLVVAPPSDVAKAGSDTVTFGLTDNATVTEKTKAGSDTVTFGLTDNAVAGIPIAKAGSDTVTFGLTDNAAAPDRYTVKAGSDTVTFGLTETAVRQAIGPTTGSWVSPPLVLPEGPIAGSTLHWDATIPSGATLTLETSTDNGATWQAATNLGPVPRLLVGTSVAKTVLVRVTGTRTSSDIATPRLHRLELHPAVDSSRDEVVPLGVFTLNDTSIDDGPNGLQIEISGADLSRKVSRNRWDNTYVVPEGSNYGEAIEQGITDRMFGATFNFASTDRLTPRLFFGEQGSNDPWDDFQDMAFSIGSELFFDPAGIAVLRPEPDPDINEPVWTFTDEADPVITNLVRRVSDENTYNKIVVTGEGTSNEVPVRGMAIDDDPGSPTYYLGPYGTVVYRFTTPMVTSDEQAQEAAEALLRRLKGATEAVEIEVVPMPALEPGDVINIVRGPSKVEGRFLIDAMRIPLGAEETMRIVGRRQRT